MNYFCGIVLVGFALGLSPNPQLYAPSHATYLIEYVCGVFKTHFNGSLTMHLDTCHIHIQACNGFQTEHWDVAIWPHASNTSIELSAKSPNCAKNSHDLWKRAHVLVLGIGNAHKTVYSHRGEIW
jgi:hypothetical protein